jgi:SAM-dependent methyltransferase
MMKYQICPICSSSKVSLQTFILQRSQHNLEIAICADCGHGTLAEPKSLEAILFIQKEKFNDEVPLPEIRYTRWPHRPALIYAEVRRLRFNGGRVLDIGCNTGLWLATLGDEWKKYGVELSNIAANIAREFTRADVFCGPIESYKAEPNSFDLITAFAVIEHVSDPKMLVYWIYEHLKPGGLLVLMTGDRESKTALLMGDKWPLYECKDHVSYFSARSLRYLLQKTGFQVVKEEWRFMYRPDRKVRITVNTIEKIKEMFRMIGEPNHDHYYCYALKIK